MSISIEFDNPKCEFTSGSVISGQVHVQVGETKSIKKIAIDFKGEVKTTWSEQEDKKLDNKNERVTVDYKGNQTLFDYRLTLVDGPGKFDLHPGKYSYRFEYTLPVNLPANWEGTNGNIRYTVKAFIDIPWSIDISCKQQIKVIPIVDLNIITHARQRFMIEKQKTIGMFCCMSGNVVFTVSAPKCGYICGETIPFMVQIENNSEAEINETVIEIKKYVDYFSTEPSAKKRSDSSVLTSGKWSTKVEPRGGQHTLNAPIQILLTELSTVNDTLIIKMNYEVEVTFRIDGMHLNLTGKLPIVIGNIPINIHGENTSPPIAMTPSDHNP